MPWRQISVIASLSFYQVTTLLFCWYCTVCDLPFECGQRSVSPPDIDMG